MNYKHKYSVQKAAAKVRGIEFQFTYEEWLAWWGDDIVNRGPYKGQLVMARIGDTGPYHPDNVRKITCSENATESNSKSIRKIQTPLGIFNSRKEAAQSHNCSGAIINHRLNKKSEQYFYIES